MKNTHIISVGASILTNFKKTKSPFEIPSIDEDAKYEIVLTDKNKFNQILEFVKKDQYKASAELNALRKFKEENSVSEVHLIVTDTFVGLITSEIIKDILSNEGIKCTSKKIPGYYKEVPNNEEEAEERFLKGLSDLRDSMIRFIKEKKQNSPESKILINATGGFKPEILILMLVGSLTKCEVYYIHEFFKRIMFLPPVYLPYINNSISDSLKEIYSLSSKRISGENSCRDFKKKFEAVYDELLAFNLITEKYGEIDDKLFEIKITSYGKLLAELK